MFKRYRDLIDAAPQKGILRFYQREEIIEKFGLKGKIRLNVIRFFINGKKIDIPFFNNVIIPRKKRRSFSSFEYLDLALSIDTLAAQELCFEKARKKFRKRIPELPEADGKPFFGYGIIHGYDEGHHGEPSVSGLFIDATSLIANPNKLIKPNSRLYAGLKFLEDLKAYYSGRLKKNPNPKKPLEKKIKSLTDPTLYSWGSYL